MSKVEKIIEASLNEARITASLNEDKVVRMVNRARNKLQLGLVIAEIFRNFGALEVEQAIIEAFDRIFSLSVGTDVDNEDPYEYDSVYGREANR